HLPLGCAPPLLSSFPTRRSSDLRQCAGFPVRMVAMIEVTDWAKDILERSHEAARRLNPQARIKLATRGSEVRAMFIDRPGPNDQDRKSTRLNSSHVSISYAVFCL